MSSQLFRLENLGDIKEEPTIIINEETFNQYVKPRDGAIYDSSACQVHGLTSTSVETMNANKIDVVWHHFTEFLVHHVKPDNLGGLQGRDL